MLFLNDIKKCKISLEGAKNLQQDFEKYLRKIRKGNKSDEQKKLYRILMFFLMQEITQSNL